MLKILWLAGSVELCSCTSNTNWNLFNSSMNYFSSLYQSNEIIWETNTNQRWRRLSTHIVPSNLGGLSWRRVPVLTWSNCLFGKINIKGREITLYVQVVSSVQRMIWIKSKLKQKDFSWVLSPGAHIPDLDYFQPPYFMSQTKSSKHTNIILHVFCFSGETS